MLVYVIELYYAHLSQHGVISLDSKLMCFDNEKLCFKVLMKHYRFYKYVTNLIGNQETIKIYDYGEF